MYLDKWGLVIIAGILIYLFYRIEKEIENLKNRVSDLEDKTEDLVGDDVYDDDDKISDMESGNL